ncbi:MAG: hypothetical protein DI498_06725 [Paracoccus denitrificans]|nr:MAG: hypothetical protein DI498_06725 [Paracoccus denitrificans]PZO84773.1 MAG: hypothetical protein DI633_06725 [Paracoccus denitrificans]
MFKRLLDQLFEPSAPPGIASDDAGIAVAALMVRVARSDDHYDSVEQSRIDGVLMRRYALDADAARTRREEAEEVEANAPDTVRFTRAIKDRVALDDRVSIIRALWDVALSDGDRGATEEAMIRLIAGLLGVSDVDSARARQDVQARAGRSA